MAATDSRLDPWTMLGLPRDAPPRDVAAAYRRRLQETDPQRVAGMDPKIMAAARQARFEVELAHRLITSPDEVSPADLAKVLGRPEQPAEDEEPAPTRKSYWRAIVLTMVMPGAGSWYGGGRMRGLVAFALFAFALIWMMGQVQAAMAAANGTMSARLQAMTSALSGMRGPFYGCMVLLLVDALVATWAHNDRLDSDAADE